MPIRSLALPGAAAIVVAVIALVLAPHRSAVPAGKAAAVTSQASHIIVPISNYAFKPPSLTVHAGTRVTWANHDATAHTATADQGSFDTGTLNTGKSKTIDFKRPGTYRYHCAFHAFMTATITVVR